MKQIELHYYAWKDFQVDKKKKKKIEVLIPFLRVFLFLVHFTKNWSRDQILVIFTKNRLSV